MLIFRSIHKLIMASISKVRLISNSVLAQHRNARRIVEHKISKCLFWSIQLSYSERAIILDLSKNLVRIYHLLVFAHSIFMRPSSVVEVGKSIVVGRYSTNRGETGLVKNTSIPSSIKAKMKVHFKLINSILRN